MHAFHRTELLLGREGYARVAGASVCVIGLGGVGSYAAEALARSGVGHLTLVDFDRVCLTNLNRQLHALRSTVGQPKADLMADRARDVHPRCDVRPLTVFYGPDTCDAILDRPYDAVLDCIDHLPNKVHLLRACLQRGLPVWSAMGAGGRLDPTRIRVSDLSETRNDPFARWVRQGLRDLGVPTDAATGVQAVWTDEPPAELDAEVEAGFVCICPDKAGSPFACDDRHQVQGTVAWMPPMFGLAMAGAVVHALAGRDAVRRPAEAPR
ncbi:MAG TPA: tRNA threonylcarbamoyladenosine dehydratase, partial [Myxococcota bacterium]|nr:tRNA threonylcarbamoyladenosine dehydratase [Myxococcota bacterium]